LTEEKRDRRRSVRVIQEGQKREQKRRGRRISILKFQEKINAFYRTAIWQTTSVISISHLVF